MRILLVGAGGVGGAIAAIAARRAFVEAVVVADYDLARAEKAVAAVGDPRFSRRPGGRLRRGRGRRAAGRAPLRRAAQRHRPALRDAAVPGRPERCGATYLDMAMSLSHPHPERPHELTGVKLGDEQFALAERVGGAPAGWPCVGMGVEPGLSDVFARYAADHLFAEIDELGRARRRRTSPSAGYDFAPSFTIWTTIEECLNPPVVWERGPRLVHDRAVQRARGVRLPGGHRPGRVRQRGARGGAPHAALGRREAGDVQVRPGRRSSSTS